MCVCRAVCHLKNIISLGDSGTFTRIDWVDTVEEHPRLLLYYGLSTLGFEFDGTTDLAVANKSAIRVGKPELGLRLLFDLRKTITKSDIMKAQARVLLGNLLSPDQRPMMVSPRELMLVPSFLLNTVQRKLSLALMDCYIVTMQRCISCWHDCPTNLLHPSVKHMSRLLQVVTDLNDEWHAMWMDGRTIFHHPFPSGAGAVAFIQAFLAGRLDAHEGGLEGGLCQFVKRRKLEHKLEPSRIGMVALMKELRGDFVMNLLQPAVLGSCSTS